VILAQLPVGVKVREKTSGMLFLVGEHGHAGYKGTTLVANHVVGFGCLDAPEENNPNQRLHLTGLNHYAFSNLHQWLNAEGEDWYRSAHEFDAPPTEENLAKRPNAYDHHGYNAYAQKPGFLSWFGADFREAIFESEVPCSDRTQASLEFIKAKAFLLSTAEAGIRTTDPLQEGSKIAVFRDFRNRAATPSVEAIASAEWQPAYLTAKNLSWYWLRTPKGNDEGFTYYAHTTCPFSHKFSCCPWVGIRPVVNVDSQLPVEASASVRGLYLIG
jgi:hypothetical protein